MLTASRVPSDSVRRVLDSVFAGPAYQWVDAPSPLRRVGEWWRWLIGVIGTLKGDHPVLFRVGFVLLIAGFGALLVHGMWVTVATARAAGRRDDQVAGRPERPRTAAWYLRAADEAAAAGRFAEALQLAFSALALRLDAAGVVRYQPSKTPHEYAREARLAADERAQLGSLVRTLYAVVFGGAPFAPDDYRTWRARADGSWRAAAH